MAATLKHAVLLSASLALTACSDSGGLVSVFGGNPQPSQGSVTTSALPGTMAPTAPINTFVGQKATQLRGELQTLQGNVAAHTDALQQARAATVANSQAYYATVAAINARLQVGTTPGNPIVTQQWTTAQGQLDRMNDDIARLNQLSAQVSADGTAASYILDSTRAAFGLSGAVDEDHKALAILEDDANRTTVAIDRLQNDIADDLNRQNAYVTSERRNMTTLATAIKSGELYGTSLANRSFQANSYASAGGLGSAGPIGSGAFGQRRALVTIKFDRPNVAYQSALYNAVSSALDRRPDAMFDVVAVSPARAGNLGTSGARRNAEAVLRSLADMGLAANRVNLSAQTSNSVDAAEVQIFAR